LVPFLLADILARVFLVCFIPKRASAILTQCSGDLGFPLVAAEIFALVSSEHGFLTRALAAADIFAFVASEKTLPFLAADIFAFVSSESLSPFFHISCFELVKGCTESFCQGVYPSPQGVLSTGQGMLTGHCPI